MDKSTKNGIITVAVLGLAGVIAYKLLKNPSGNKMNDGGNGMGGGTTGGGTTGGGTTGGGTTGGGTTPPPPPADLSNSQISKIADDIFEAMDGYGTNEDDIISAFNKLRTNNDFTNLVSAYGTRTVSSGWGNVFMSDYTGDLSGALHSELSSGWIDDINNILRSKGIIGRV